MSPPIVSMELVSLKDKFMELVQLIVIVHFILPNNIVKQKKNFANKELFLTLFLIDAHLK